MAVIKLKSIESKVYHMWIESSQCTIEIQKRIRKSTNMSYFFFPRPIESNKNLLRQWSPSSKYFHLRSAFYIPIFIFVLITYNNVVIHIMFFNGTKFDLGIKISYYLVLVIFRGTNINSIHCWYNKIYIHINLNSSKQ